MINLIPGELAQWIPRFVFAMLAKAAKGKARKRKEKSPKSPRSYFLRWKGESIFSGCLQCLCIYQNLVSINSD